MSEVNKEANKTDETRKAPSHFVVFLGRVEQVYEETPVKASAILQQGGAVPVEEFVLEALVGESGRVDHEFQADEDVHLDHKHRKHFRAVPRGGGRA